MVEGADEERGMFPPAVGEQLADERVRQQLELTDVAARTRIPFRHLEAIESGRNDALPALPYSAGFVKSYANMLGLDGQALSRAFREQVGEERRAYFEPEAYEPVDPSRVPSRLLAMIALGVALLLGMGYLLLRFESDNSDLAKLAADTAADVRPVVAQPAPPPPVALPAAPAEPAVPTGPISVAASEDAWIKVAERDGSKTYYVDVLKAGDNFAVPEDAVDPILRTSRAQSLKVLVGTTELPPVGPPDTLVRAYSLKRDALIAIATAKPGEPPVLPDVAPAASTATTVDTDALPKPRRLRRHRDAPPELDPTGNRPGSTEPISDADQRP